MFRKDDKEELTTAVIHRELDSFEGDALMIGCGHGKTHSFSYSFLSTVNSTELHPAKDFYLVSLSADYSDEGHPDVEGDFFADDVFKYLNKRKFNLICFEAVTDIFQQTETCNKALEQAKQLLAENGVCFIFGGGNNKKSLKAAVSHFKYSYSLTYGFNGAWSLIGSDTPFDLLDLMRKSPYLNYMGNNVLKLKGNLEISYNYYEDALNRHMMSSKDMKLLAQINPFARDKAMAINKMIEELPEEKDEPTKTYIPPKNL